LLPAEYPALQELPEPWRPTDIVATATLVQAIFAIGGGDEVDSAVFNRSLVQRYGAARGNTIWRDLPSQTDPEAPAPRGKSFRYNGIFVELGRGVDYAWSATPASSDIIDERLEKLCNPDGSPPTLQSTAYLYRGVCTPMYERTDRQIAKPSPGGTGAPSVITI